MKIVHIKWVDSVSLHRWQTHEKIEEFADEPLDIHETVGFLIRDTDEAITVIQSMSADCKGEAMKIPKVAVQEVIKLGSVHRRG